MNRVRDTIREGGNKQIMIPEKTGDTQSDDHSHT